MSFKDLNFQNSYETTSTKEQLLEEFYIPLLQNSKKYYRIAGYFSSTSLIVASEGIEGLIKNGGKMYLLVSPELSDDDYSVIVEHGSILPSLTMFDEIKEINIPHEHLQALAWLLDNNLLEIKIVVAKRTNTSIFHQKIGIVFDDENNIMSFSGSINETAQAWLNNIEEFKVFRSWEPGQVDYLQSDLTKFLAYWKNERKEIASVYDVPEAIKSHIVKMKPKDIYDLNIMSRYKKNKSIRENTLSLFDHQKRAISKWKDNEYSILMEMATGTGKTRTAIGGMLELIKAKKKLLIIIATPQNTLSKQWYTDIKKLGINIDICLFADGSNQKKYKELELLMLNISDDKYSTAIVFTTHNTASDSPFINIITKNKFDTEILFICDECHAIGSKKQRRALLDIYDYRIGLSATPDRMFDDFGTELIKQYFGNKSFEFTISDALSTINPITGRSFLNQYIYIPVFVSLTETEMKTYQKITQQIYSLKNQEDYDEEDLQKLYEKRAKKLKDAENKLLAFDALIEKMNPSKIRDTIAFVSDKQIEEVFRITSSKGIKRAKITEDESTSKVVTDDGETERQSLITQFSNRQLQMLVGMKCLDEGIDIPNARIAILLSNSTNPREYVQRIGRVIRQAPNKQQSIIYDFIVTPPSGSVDGSGILEKEAKRARMIALNAINYDDVVDEFRMKGVDLYADQ